MLRFSICKNALFVSIIFNKFYDISMKRLFLYT